MIRRSLAMTAIAFAALAVAAPAHAQGKGKGHKSTPPSSTTLPSPVSTSAGALPFAWIDDASVLPSGTMALSISTLAWRGFDLSEVDVPIVGMALGVADRVQIGASIPRVMGSSDPNGVVAGLGTTFVSAKIGVLDGAGSGVKLAVAPTLEILGPNAAQALAPGEGRWRLGVPLSVEVDRGAARVFGSAGFFAGGVRFAGGGVGGQVTPRLSLSASIDRAWTLDGIGGVVHDRREISGGAGFAMTPRVSFFGSLGQSFATADVDGAGTTLSGGILILLSAAVVK